MQGKATWPGNVHAGPEERRYDLSLYDRLFDDALGLVSGDAAVPDRLSRRGVDDDIASESVPSDVGGLDDQGTFEIPQLARRDVTGERRGSLGFRYPIRILLFAPLSFRIAVNFRCCLGRRLLRGQNIVQVVVIEVGVHFPFAPVQGVGEFVFEDWSGDVAPIVSSLVGAK